MYIDDIEQILGQAAELDYSQRPQPRLSSPFITKAIGDKAATALGQSDDYGMTKGWLHFRENFEKLNPGKPAEVTRRTWRALTVSNSGGYHKFVAKFRQQAAKLQITDEASLIEQFLFALPPGLRDKVYLNGHRNWHAGEFEQLVTCTTDRVNSQPIVNSGSSKENKSQKRGRQDNDIALRGNDKRQRHSGGGADHQGRSRTFDNKEVEDVKKNWHFEKVACFKNATLQDTTARSAVIRQPPGKFLPTLTRKTTCHQSLEAPLMSRRPSSWSTKEKNRQQGC